LEAVGLLRATQEALKTILRAKRISYSQVIKVMYASTHLQDELINMQLEDHSEWKQSKAEPEEDFGATDEEAD
jgi:hypothetical protein